MCLFHLWTLIISAFISLRFCNSWLWRQHILNVFWHWKWKSAQSCQTLCDPMDSPWNSPGQNTGVSNLSFIQRIFPTQGSNPGLPHCRRIVYQLTHKGSPRILEWVAVPFAKRFSAPRNQTSVSCIGRQILYCWAPGKPWFQDEPENQVFSIGIYSNMDARPETPHLKLNMQ